MTSKVRWGRDKSKPVIDTSCERFTSSYDDANRLEETWTPGNKRYTAQYDPASQLTTLQLGNGGTRKLAYDNRGYMTTQVDSGSSGAVSTIVDTYDPGGRKTKQVRDGVTSTYTMDNVGWLTLQNKGGDLSSFAYDNVGHLTLKHNAGESAVTMTRNLLGQVTTYTDGSTLCTNTWDVKGNLTNENIGGVLTTYGWDQENRMTSRARGTGLMNFVYDESHHLRHKEIPGEEGVDNVSFNYLDDVVFTRYEEFFGARTEQMTPWQGVNLGNASHDFVLDSLGNVVGSVRSSGVGNKISYFPYGEMEPSVSTPVSSYWKFVGGYGVYAYSEEVYLMWHRWFDANVGSFRSIDPRWPRESAYRYVNGMAHMAVDWDGLIAVSPRAPTPWTVRCVPAWPPCSQLCYQQYLDDLDDCWKRNRWLGIAAIVFCRWSRHGRLHQCELCCDENNAYMDGENDRAVCNCFSDDDLMETVNNLRRRVGSEWPIPDITECSKLRNG